MEPGGIRRVARVLGVLGVLVLAASLRANLTSSGCPGRVFMRNDESHYVPLVVQFLGGDWSVDYFVNPTLTMYLLYAVVAVRGWVGVLTGTFDSYGEFVLEATIDPYQITMAGRWMSFVLGVASVSLLYTVGARAFSARVGLLAALALALDRTHVNRGALAGNEVPMVFLLLALFLALLAYLERPSARRHAWCGVLLGLAASTKYNAGIHVVTLATATWLAFRGTPRTRLLQGRFTAGFLTAPAAFLVGSPWVLLRPERFAEDFLFQASLLHEGYGPRVLGWTYYPLQFGHENAGVLFAVACAVGLVVLAARAVRRDERSLLLLAAVVPTYLALGSGIFGQMRFLLPAIPFVLLAGAAGVDAVASALARAGRAGRPEPRLRGALTAALGIALLAPHAVALERAVESMYRRVDERAALLDWMRENLDPNGGYLHVISSPHCLFFPIRRDLTTVPEELLATPAQRERLAAARREAFRSRPLRAILQSEEDIDGFRRALSEVEETHVILSLWSPRRFPRNFDLESELRRLLRGRTPDRGCTYWGEAVEELLRLERTGYVAARGRSSLLCVLALP